MEPTTDNNEFILCDCHCHAISLSSDTEIEEDIHPYVYISIWSSIFDKHSLWDRIKTAFRVIFKGSFHMDQVILTIEDGEKFSKILNKLIDDLKEKREKAFDKIHIRKRKNLQKNTKELKEKIRKNAVEVKEI